MTPPWCHFNLTASRAGSRRASKPPLLVESTRNGASEAGGFGEKRWFRRERRRGSAEAGALLAGFRTAHRLARQADRAATRGACEGRRHGDRLVDIRVRRPQLHRVL